MYWPSVFEQSNRRCVARTVQRVIQLQRGPRSRLQQAAPGTGLPVLPALDGRLLAGRQRFPRQLFAGVDARNSKRGPRILAGNSGMRLDLVDMQQAPALRTLHPKVGGEFVLQVVLNPDNFAVLV